MISFPHSLWFLCFKIVYIKIYDYDNKSVFDAINIEPVASHLMWIIIKFYDDIELCKPILLLCLITRKWRLNNVILAGISLLVRFQLR
jgi:hypothetical protein